MSMFITENILNCPFLFLNGNFGLLMTRRVKYSWIAPCLFFFALFSAVI